MPLIALDGGVHINAERVGDGPPVVLLAGWAFDHRIWDRQVRVLAGAGYEAVCVDLRGHGLSDRPYTGYDMATLAEDVRAAIVALELNRPVLLGWSLGGLAAFRVAVSAPELLSGLVLVGSNGVAASRHADFPFGAPAADHEAAVVSAELADRFSARRALVRSAFAGEPDDEVVERLLWLTMRTPSWAGAATLSTLLNVNQAKEVSRLTVPTAQIMGASDPVFSRRGAAWLAEQVPGLRQTVLDGCGHYPMIEAADAFDEALLAAVRHVRTAGRVTPEV